MSAHHFYSTIHEFPLFIIPSIYCMKAKKQEGKWFDFCK
ncbi:hypothetical protein J576_0797 [Acinetobacter sp. 766875]|nr:hypothetical protein J525_2642 [Acinetobacter sp. 21871]EXE52170.1 hypothetical protein J576_0797 [Acinetobacter sp. 766875]EXR34751.1 hypothetical protein J689_0181 [Acinetobacter sp. 1179249]EXR64075.1 hypothetical protein J678_1524 [Acinetobacter sp. 1424608]